MRPSGNKVNKVKLSTFDLSVLIERPDFGTGVAAVHAVARFSSNTFERAEFSLVSAGEEFSKIFIGS
jgi:hypothetical protein